MTISLEVLARIRGTLSASVEGQTASWPVNVTKTQQFADGVAADQADAVYVDEFSIAASGSADYDLAGSLEDALGNVVDFTNVKAIMVIADTTNVNDVVIGNGTNPFVGPFDDGTATVTLKPGGVLLVTNPAANGWTVTGASADVLKLANSSSGSAVTGTLVVIGEN